MNSPWWKNEIIGLCMSVHTCVCAHTSKRRVTPPIANIEQQLKAEHSIALNTSSKSSEQLAQWVRMEKKIILEICYSTTDLHRVYITFFNSLDTVKTFSPMSPCDGETKGLNDSEQEEISKLLGIDASGERKANRK